MNNIIRRVWKRSGMVSIEDLRGFAFQAEDGAHTFEIRGVDAGGEELELSGTVGAIFMRADNTDVAITGDVTDGVVMITLPEECYDMPGRFGLTVYLTSDEQTVAIYAAIGSVSRTTTGNVSPGTEANVEDLIERIEAAVATIPSDYSTLSTTVGELNDTLNPTVKNLMPELESGNYTFQGTHSNVSMSFDDGSIKLTSTTSPYDGTAIRSSVGYKITAGKRYCAFAKVKADAAGSHIRNNLAPYCTMPIGTTWAQYVTQEYVAEDSYASSTTWFMFRFYNIPENANIWIKDIILICVDDIIQDYCFPYNRLFDLVGDEWFSEKEIAFTEAKSIYDTETEKDFLRMTGYASHDYSIEGTDEFMSRTITAIPVCMCKTGLTIYTEDPITGVPLAYRFDGDIANFRYTTAWTDITESWYGFRSFMGSIAYGNLMNLNSVRPTFDINGNWFIEFVFDKIENIARNTAYINFYGTDAVIKCAIRHLNDLEINGFTVSGAFTGAQAEFKAGTNHVLFIKNSDTISLYINGLFFKSVTVTADYTPGTTEPCFYVNASLHIKLLRIGSNADTNVTARFTNCSPLTYKAENDTILCEILPENMRESTVFETVSGKTVTLLSNTLETENPYPELIAGEGAPDFIPQFIGQRYYDKADFAYYTAIGISGAANWSYEPKGSDLAGKQDALRSGITIKTINGVSVLGAGNIDAGGGGGGGSSGTVVNVVDYGATGNGATDDTEAIMAALEVVRGAGGTLFFPYNGGNCTYLTRKGLVLESSMGVDADRGAILKNASAVLEDEAGNPGTGSCAVTTLTAAIAQGAHSCVVSSTTGLAVGQEITIYTNNSSGYEDTHADITEISGKTVTFSTERFTHDGTDGGAVSAHASGSYLITDFALIETIARDAEHITIKNITLQPCGNANEPYVYTISPIHQTKQGWGYRQNDIRVIGVTIDGSAQDGISIQGSGDAWIEDCIVKNVKWKGIHFGTTCDGVIARGNMLDNCGNAAPASDSGYNMGGGGIYWCVNNHRVIVENNRINNCRRGCFGFDFRGNGETDTDSIISGNTFSACAYAGVRSEGGMRLNVSGNIFKEFGSTAVPIQFASGGSSDASRLQHAVIANNIIGGFENGYTNTEGAIVVEHALYPIITGNNIQPNTNATGSAGIVVTGTIGALIVSNVSDGVDISDSGNESCIAENNITIGA